jgi:hypothetical protein
MKGNYESLVSFAQEIDRRSKAAQDFRVPSSGIKMLWDCRLELQGAGEFKIQDFAHSQIASKLEIPKIYYDKMAAIPGLRTLNVNHWLNKPNRAEKGFLVRTLDGENRAFLSDRYRPIDNVQILSAIFPAVKDLGDNILVKSHSITPEKMFLQLVFPGVSGEVKVGDVVEAGVTISNSEIGSGTFVIQKLIWRRICSNGMNGQNILSQKHIGPRIDSDDHRIFRDDTLLAENKAYELIMRDTFADAIKGAWFEAEVAKMKEAAEDVIRDPVQLGKNMVKENILSLKDTQAVLVNLYEEGRTRWGLVNSITALAHSIEDPMQQFAYETLGNDVLSMPRSNWEKLAA